MYYSLLWRLYVLVAVVSVLVNLAILNFRSLRNAVPYPWAKRLLASLILPRVSEWHVLLSDMLLPKDDVLLSVDVLTKNGTLYQGGVQDRMLGGDGSLQSITLSDPRRFRREEFQKAKEADPTVGADAYWRPIPGKLFVLLGSDVVNVNVRYPPKPSSSLRLKDDLSKEDIEALRGLLAKLTKPDSQSQP